MKRHLVPATGIFRGAAGNRLVCDVFGEEGPPVLLLHGGGQTRHAWRATAERIALSGSTAYAVDQRGHGDSDWIADGSYAFPDYAADVTRISDALAARGEARPVAIGASLGGVASLVAAGMAAREGREVFSGIVLVDITPRVDGGGVASVQAFMAARAHEGFATIAEAADAVAAYLPHRPRPRSHDGLKKNLRLHPDGRWRWHWDPRFLDGPRTINTGREELQDLLTECARTIRVPALLVRGGSSELVHEAHAREFLELVPHAEYVDVADARHMVVGDSNDRFSEAVLGFLGRLSKGAGAKMRVS